MHTSRRSIAIDMDGVLADTAAQFREWYFRESGIRLGPNAFDGLPEDECLPDGAVRRYLYQPNFFRTTPLVPGAQEAIAELMEQFDVYIVSAAMEFPNSLAEKLDWLREHFPFISWHNIIFCGTKAIINTDYMVDDHVKNLDRFPGKTFLFTAPHNLKVRHHQRVSSWEEAIRALKTELAFSYRGNSL
ncbi:5' nucleotidase, NT5C type [Cnuella takakiae]|nr:5'(3')-deoxyribonucleotidase [Cnuella takakiae]OLY94991.1 5'(3')-deoxyribonucleotidase [Cnuella takakiae]